MLAIARKAAIRESLQEHKSVRITELAAQLNVTKETIRRDLREMEQNGELIRTHGGAYILDGVQNDIDVGTRQVLKIPEKERIAQKCDSLIQSGDYIYLDGSTTCWSIARLIAPPEAHRPDFLAGDRKYPLCLRHDQASCGRRRIFSEKQGFYWRRRHQDSGTLLRGQGDHFLPERASALWHHRHQRRPRPAAPDGAGTCPPEISGGRPFETEQCVLLPYRAADCCGRHRHGPGLSLRLGRLSDRTSYPIFIKYCQALRPAAPGKLRGSGWPLPWPFYLFSLTSYLHIL